MLLTGISFIYPQAQAEKSSLIQTIINHTYNYEFDKADKLINEGLKKFPGSPKYYFLYIGNEMIKSMKYRDEAKVKDKQGITDSINNLIIPFAEKAIDKFEDNTKTLEDKFFLGCIYGYLGRIHGIQGSWMSAFGTIKTGRNIMEEVLEADSTYYDAYLVLGMVNYFADRMSGVVGIVASILGLSGDREVGLNYLKIAEKKGIYTSAQAAYILLELYTRLENNEFAGIPYFERFVKQFPKNGHVKNWYCRELMDINMIDKAAEVIANDKDGVIDDYVMARFYNKTGNYKLSNERIERIRKTKETYYNRYYEHALFLNAMNYIMLDDLKKVNEIKNELSENFRPVFDELLANKYAAKEISKLGELIGQRGTEAEIHKIFASPPKLNGGDKFLAGMLEYYKGVNYFQSRNYSEAANIFNKLKSSKNDFFTVESVKYLLEIYYNTNISKSKAKSLIEFIDDLDNESLAYRAKDIEKKYKL